jgi:protein O-mannosyl-transferase
VKTACQRPFIFSWQVSGLCLFLAAITFAVFGQTLHHEFINFDDNGYVYENPFIARGLTVDGIIWAFTHVHSANWHPLTGISHMLDCQLYGLNPGGHHLTNVLLHTATVIALFLVLRQMTGALWRSAFVAAVFAIHPLRAESVAWVAERKDVLSGLFFMLTIGAYVHYARRSWSPARYGLVMLLFALGLMCKPMLVTLPLVLLLLDYWPLQRKESVGKLTMEKLPLLALSAASCVATLLAQHKFIQSTESYSLPLRLVNALVTCMVYLGQMVWPAGLAVLYPYPHDGLPPWEIALAGTLLAGLSAAALWQWRKQPWLLMGWVWYLVMLLPVLGLIQVGNQAHADRYTYLPQIGICIAVTWLAAEWHLSRMAFGGLMTAVIAVLMVCAWKQTTYWKDNETLWNHTINCTTNNFEARSNLGSALMEKGKVDDAITQFQEALRINPRAANVHNNLGTGLHQKGRVDEAIAEIQKALQINPDNALFHFNLAKMLQQTGRTAEAIAQYQMDLQIDPADVDAQYNLAWLLATSPQASLRNGAKALQLARQANELTGGRRPIVLHSLAAAFAEVGKFDDAVHTAQNAIELAQALGRLVLVAQLNDELKYYQAGRPFRQ